MSEPPALSLSSNNEDFKPRISSHQRRADPPSAVRPVSAVPVVKAAEPPALVARVVARQKDPNLGLPTYKSQINGRSVLKIDGNASSTPSLSDSTMKSIELARKQQQEDRTRPKKPSPPASLTNPVVKASNASSEPAKKPSSKKLSSTQSRPSASPTSSPKQPIKQGSVKAIAPPVNPAHEPAPASPIASKAPPVHRPLNETWEFVPPNQERTSCCVIV